MLRKNKYTKETDGNMYTKTVIKGNETTNYTYRYSYNSLIKITKEVNGEVVNEDNITYNKLYPIKINNIDYEWDNNSLIRIGTNTYEYNSSNIRTKKTVGTKVYTYTLDNTNIIKEHILDTTNNIDVTLEYIYDANNTLVGVIENENIYYYDRDITGLILGLVDTNGNYVVKYTYTAYGEVEKDILVNTNISTYNPFMYKGYYYDVETNLYYCKSRYYSPELCRFISPDDIEYLDPESVNGLNLYCYCGNDPIMYVDPSGHAWYNVLWDWVNTIAGFLDPISTLTALGSIAVATIAGRWSEVVEDWNNGCLNPFNQDASIAKKAKVLSFYKGSTVVRQDIIGYFSAFGTIWLNTENLETDIMHEYGHSIQERFLGPLYWTRIAIPSVSYYIFASHENIDYYSTPWERTADWLGGVKGNRGAGYKKGSLAWAIAENLLGPIVIPFYFWFGY